MPRGVDDPYPFEDLEAGRYVHPRSVNLVSITSRQKQVGEAQEWFVGVNDFMEVQHQRDEQRKTLGFVNVYARRGDLDKVLSLLDRAGFDAKDAEAMEGLIAWAESERKGEED